MKLTSSNLYNALSRIKEAFKNKDYNYAYNLSKEALKEFPYSTELISLYLTLAQLSNQEDMSLNYIQEQLMDLMNFQDRSNIQTIIDNAGILHNVLNKKGTQVDLVFEEGYNVMKVVIKDFLEIYFDYLQEKGKAKEMKKIIGELSENINKIPNSI